LGISTFFFAGTVATSSTRNIQPPAGEKWVLGGTNWVYAPGTGGSIVIRMGTGSYGDLIIVNNSNENYVLKQTNTKGQIQPKYWFDNTTYLVVKGGSSPLNYAVSGVKLPSLGGNLFRQNSTSIAPGGIVRYVPPANKVWVIMAVWANGTVLPFLSDGVNETAKSNMQSPAGETWFLSVPPIEGNQFYARGYEGGVITLNPTDNAVNWGPHRPIYADNQNFPSVLGRVAAKFGYTGFKLP
jgi:hypothetical protein